MTKGGCTFAAAMRARSGPLGSVLSSASAVYPSLPGSRTNSSMRASASHFSRWHSTTTSLPASISSGALQFSGSGIAAIASLAAPGAAAGFFFLGAAAALVDKAAPMTSVVSRRTEKDGALASTDLSAKKSSN